MAASSKVGSTRCTVAMLSSNALSTSWQRGGLGELEIGGLGRIVLHELNHAARNQGEVESQLAGGHGFLVRLPGQLVFGQAAPGTGA